MHRRTVGTALILALALLAAAAGPRAAVAQADERCFSETGYCISGAIRAFWEQNGGLAVFGLPLGPQQAAVGEDGQSRQAQWFERARLELHPENPAPYNVLLGRLGVDRLAQQGRDWQSFPRLDPNDADAESCRYFRETDHQVCGQFLEAFRSYGLSFAGVPGVSYEESLALFGLPISEAMTETIEGKEYTVQWFERARFELHPENQPPYTVLFGRLGAEISAGQGAGATLEGRTWRLVSYGDAAAPTPAANTDATISFDGSNVSGNTGCNGFGGGYTASATTITFGNLISTLRACEEPISTQEQAILGTLQGEVPYSIAGGQLRISSADGARALTYTQAPAELAKVTGTVSYLQRIALPPSAVIQVQLVDVSRADAPAIVISSSSFEAAGRQVPIPFELTYDPAQIDERFTYAVQARITIDGQLRFISTQAYLVITRGNPTNVDMVLQPV